MEWNTKIPEIPKGTTRWFAHPDARGASSYFLHFSSHGTVLNSYSFHSPWRTYSLTVPMDRKAGFLHKKMNWASFDFALNNAKFHKRPGFPAELFDVNIFRNPTNNRNYGDHIEFEMFLPFPKQFHPATVRGWVEAKVYPGSDLMSFRNARIMFV